MLQRKHVAAKKNIEPHLVGSTHMADSKESEVVKSLKYAKTELAVKTDACSKKVIDVELVSDTVQVVDGIEVELVLNLKGSSDQAYHKIVVLWTATSHGLVPQLLLPSENGTVLAWCTLLDASTSHSLAELAKKEGHEAVKRYHQMLGYKGGWNTSTNRDKLLQLKTASCSGSDNLPATYDLRYHDTHGPCFTAEMVHNHGGCGSCWAFAAAHAMTARLCMQDQADIVSNPDGMGRRFMSVQTVLSCGTGAGCDGGWMADAFHEWQRGGAPLARDYEYHPAYGGQPWHSMGYGCEWGEYAKPYKTTDVYSVSTQVTAMMEELYCNGPFTVAYAVYNNFFGYTSGVYQDIGDGEMAGGHAVTLVGWGNLDGTDFWELQNSWGNGWGDGGFFKMLRGADFCWVESWGLTAASVAKTDGSWMYEDWGMCSLEGEDMMKTRDIKCVDNVDTSSIISSLSCPYHNGWPDKSIWPNVNSGVPAEVAAKAVCGSDDNMECTNAFCYGHGSGEDVQGTCTCTCFAGYAGERCDVCATGFEGYPTCRESCTRADCSGHGDASGVKWNNEFGEQLDSCSCMCDEGYSGPTCASNCGNDCTTTTTTQLYGFTVQGPCPYDESTGCATSGNYPNIYPDDETCRLTPSAGAVLNVVDFNTELGWDFLTVQGVKISGAKSQADAFHGMTLTEDIIWESDYIYGSSGWKLCASPPSTTTTTPHPCTDGSHGCDSENGICVEVEASDVIDATAGVFTNLWEQQEDADVGAYLVCPGPPDTDNVDSRGLEISTISFTLQCSAITKVKFQTYSLTVDGKSDSLYLKEGGFQSWHLGTRSSWGWSDTSPEFSASLGENTVTFTGREDNTKVQKFKIVQGQDSCSFMPSTKVVLAVGSSGEQTATAVLSEPATCPTLVNNLNWLDGHTWPDVFQVSQQGLTVTVTRTDLNEGWGMDLWFECDRTAPHNYKCECADGFHCIDGCDGTVGHTCQKIETTTTTTTVFVGFRVVEGPCLAEADGSCVSSPNFPQMYGDNQDCRIMASPGLVLDVKLFKTEKFDVLIANGQEFSGEDGTAQALDGMHLQGNMSWHSDESIGKEGWKICYDTP